MVRVLFEKLFLCIMGAAEWDRMIFVNKIIHCQDQWKIISEERACHWSESKDIESSSDFQLKRIAAKKKSDPFEPLPPFPVCCQAGDCTLGDNNAQEFSLIYRNMSLWTLSAKKNISKVE